MQQELDFSDIVGSQEDIPNPFAIDQGEQAETIDTKDTGIIQNSSCSESGCGSESITTEDKAELQPTHEELQKSMLAIKQKYPNIAIQSIITTLYQKLVVDKSVKEVKPNYKVGVLKYAGAFRKNWYYEEKLSYHKNFPKMKKKNPNIIQLNHLLLTTVDKNNLLKRITAKCFMDYGIGYEHIVKEVKILQYPVRPTKRKYDKMVGEVATLAFRQLEKFIIQHFQPNIKRSSVKDIEVLHPILLDPFRHFTMDQTKIYHNFIRVNYDQEAAGTLVEKQPAYNFYKKIYRIKASIKTVGLVDEQLRRKYLKQNEQFLPSAAEAIVHLDNGRIIWTRQMEHHLLYYYVQEGKISKAKKVFRKKYNNIDVLGDLITVRRRFYKIMRASVRILQKYMQKYDEQVKAKLQLQEEQTKLLISAPQSYNVRVYLCYLYRYSHIQPEFIQKAVIEVNEFLVEKTMERFQQREAKGILKM